MDPITTFLNKLLQVAPEGTDLDTKHHIYMQSKWGDQCTELLMQDSRTNKCYKGQLKKTEMQEAADDLEIDYDIFSAECRSALTANIRLPGFECEIDETEMVFRLTKKQEFDLQYLEVKLKELKNNYELLDTAIQLIESGLKKEEMKVQTAHKSDQDYEELLKSYQQCVEEKKMWKQQMLRKFALLLNSKKDQIVKQQKELQRCRKTDDMDIGSDEEDQMKPASNTKRDAKKKIYEKSPQRCTGKSRAKVNLKDKDVEDDDDDFNAETQPFSPPKRIRCGRVSDYGDEDDNDERGDSNDSEA